MGSSASKISISDALQKLRQDQLSADSEELTVFWSQFWPDNQLVDSLELSAQLTPTELRQLRQHRPQHLAQLVLQCCHQLIKNSRHGLCNSSAQQTVVINCARLLIRLLPFAYEDEDLASLLWTHSDQKTTNDQSNLPLAVQLSDAVCDLLFCPDFTVAPNPTSLRHRQPTRNGHPQSTEPDTPPPELCEIDSCEYIWKSGVGFNAPGDCGSSGIFGLLDHSAATQTQYEAHRADLLRLLLVLFSETMYEEPVEAAKRLNPCVAHFTSDKNRHCLAMFTSLLNTALGYEPPSAGYFSFMGSSSASNAAGSGNGGSLSPTEQLVELSLQVLIVCLDQQDTNEFQTQSSTLFGSPLLSRSESIDSNENVRNPHCANQVCSLDNKLNEKGGFYADSSSPPTQGSVHSFSSSTNRSHQHPDRMGNSLANLFVNYLARIHRDEDLQFILNGFVKLLGQPLASTYLPSAARRLQFHQELLILFWRFCDLNKKFLYHTLKSSQVLDVLVPILYHLNESKSDPGRLGLVHIGVFIILLLSGERNFGVRLNKPFRGSAIVFRQLPIFSGSHADLLIVVFHRLITAGSAKLQSLFECLLTILVNVSPYVKSLSMVSAHKLLHFFEAFSTPWFLYCNESNHHLVFYLLEIFNNIVQYQFDGNANLIYTLIRKRHCFHQLANLPTDGHFINQSLGGRSKKSTLSKSQSMNAEGGLINNEKDSLHHKGSLSTIPQEDEEQLFGPPAQKNKEQKSQIKSDQRLPSAKTKKPAQLALEKVPQWQPQSEWVTSWKQKLPLQTIMRMLQVLVPQVEKMCLDKGITDENEILKFLENGTLVGLLPVPHPILIRKYQTNSGTSLWFRTYLWGVIYLRNISPPIWYDTEVRLFEIQKL